MATTGLQIIPAVLEIPSAVPGTQYDFIVQVKNMCSRACRVRCLPTKSREWKVQPTVVSNLAPGLTVSVPVSFIASSEDPVQDALRFQYFNQVQDGQVEVPLRANLRAACLRMSKQLVDYGHVVPGSAAVQDVVLHNTGQLPMDVALKLPEGEPLHAVPSSLHLMAGGEETVRLTYSPTATGVFQTVVEVHSSIDDVGPPMLLQVAAVVTEPSIFIMDAETQEPISLLQMGPAFNGCIARRAVVLVNNSPDDAPYGIYAIPAPSMEGGLAAAESVRGGRAAHASDAASTTSKDERSTVMSARVAPGTAPSCSPQSGILHAWSQQVVEISWKLPKASREAAFTGQRKLAAATKLRTDADQADLPDVMDDASSAAASTLLELNWAPPGVLRALLQVRRGSDVSPCVSIGTEITPVPPTLAVSQQHFNFGAAGMREPKHIVFTVHNDNSMLPLSFEVQRLGYFSVEPASGLLQPGEGTNLLARYQPGAFGGHRSKLAINVMRGSTVLGSTPLAMQGMCEASASATRHHTAARKANMPPESFRPKLDLVAHGEDQDMYGLQIPLSEATERMRQQSAPVGTRQHAPAIPVPELEATAAARKKHMWETEGALLDANGAEIDEGALPAERAKYTYSIRDLKALTAHKQQYSDYVTASRIQRAEAQAASKQPELLDDPVHLNDDPKRGLVEPGIRLPPSPDRLWMVPSSAGRMPAHAPRNRKLDPMVLTQHKYKPAPTTQAEMRDFAAVLSPEELQLIDAPCSELDFGAMTTDSSASRNFAVSNRGRGSIVVSIRLPAGVDELARSGPASQVVPPGGTAGFDIHLDTRRTGDLECSISWSINEKHTYRATVRALVLPRRLQVDHDRLYFRFPTNSAAPELIQRVNLKNPGTGPVHWRGSLPNDAPYSLRPAAGVIAPSETHALHVVYRPRQGVDPKATLTLQVLPQDNDSRSHTISLDADSEDVQLSLLDDSVVEFGALAAGTAAEKRAVIQNSGTSVAVWSVVAAPLHVEVSPMDGRILPGDSMEMEVRIDANAASVITSAAESGAAHDSAPEHIVLAARGGHTLRVPVHAQVLVPDISIVALNPERGGHAGAAGEATSLGSTVVFGGATVGGALRRQIQVRNDSIVPSQLVLSLVKHPQFFIEPLPEDGAPPGTLRVLPEHTVLIDGRALHREVTVALAASSCVNLGLLFLPTSVRSHHFKLPASVPGLPAQVLPKLKCQVSAEGLPSRVAVSERVLDFEQQVVPAAHSRKIPYSKQLTLTNVSGEPLTWEADISTLHAHGTEFSVSPAAGALHPGEFVVLDATFLPASTSQVQATLPIYLDDTLRLAKMRAKAEAQAIAAGMPEEDIADAVSAAVSSMGMSSGTGEAGGERPHLAIDFVGAGIPPQLSFDCPAVVLPAVPLHTTATAKFHIVNSGFDHLQVVYRPPPQISGGARAARSDNRAFARDVSMPRIPLTVEFPEGTTLSLARQRIPVVLHFTPVKSMGFTVPLVFEDGQGGAYSIPVTAVADNCLLTNYPFVADHVNDHVLFVKPYTAPSLLPAEALAAKLAGDLEQNKASFTVQQHGDGPARNVVHDAPSPQRAVGSGRSSKQGAGQGHGNLAGVVQAGAASSLTATVDGLLAAGSKQGKAMVPPSLVVAPVHDPQSPRARFTDASYADSHGCALADMQLILPWLNSELFTVPVEQFPADLAHAYGKPLWDAVEALAGNAISGRVVGRALPAENKARLELLLKHNTACLAFLRSRGCLVHQVTPQQLLQQDDYVQVQIAAPGTYPVPATGPVLQYRTPQAVDAARARETMAWAATSAAAWLTVCMQVVRVFLLQRLSLQTLLSLPGMSMDDAAAAAVEHVAVAEQTAREDALQDEASGGRNKTAAAAVLARDFSRVPAVQRARRAAFSPDPLLSGSNVMSVPELVLARWLEWHHNQVMAGLPRRVVDFSKDLQDGVILAAVILRHAPHLADAELAAIKLQPLTHSDMLHNLELCIGALRALDLEPPFQPSALLQPSADAAEAVGLAAARRAQQLGQRGGGGFYGAKISPDGQVSRPGAEASVPLIASAQLADAVSGGMQADPEEAEAIAKVALADAAKGVAAVRAALWGTPGVLAHTVDSAARLSEISQRFGLLVALWLFSHLPGVIPRESLYFDCVLGADNEQELEVSNDSEHPLVYKASLVGDPAFALGQHKVTVPAQSTALLRVRCRPLKTRAHVGRLILHGVRQGGRVGQTMVFTLRALVTKRLPLRTVQASSPLYQPCTVEAPVRNSQPHQVQVEMVLANLPGNAEPGDNVPPHMIAAQQAELHKLQAAPTLGSLLDAECLRDAVATAAAAGPASAAVPPAGDDLLAAFYMRPMRLTLKPDTLRKLPVQFFPRSLGVHRAVLSFFLPKLGEQVIELVAEASLPAPQASLVVNALYKQKLERELELPWRNAQACDAELALLQRLPPAERPDRAEQFRARLIRGELLPVLGPKAGQASAAARHAVQYSVECDSPYVELPPTFVLRQGGSSAAANVESKAEDGAAAADVDDALSYISRGRTQVEVHTPRSTASHHDGMRMQQHAAGSRGALRMVVRPPAPGKFPVQVLLTSKYDVRLIKMVLEVALPQVDRELELRCPAGSHVEQGIPLVNNTHFDWQFSAEYTPSSTHWTVQDEGEDITPDIQEVLAELMTAADGLRESRKTAALARQLSARASGAAVIAPHSLLVPAHDRAVLPIRWAPPSCGMQSGTLVLAPLNSGTPRLQFQVHGIGTAPTAQHALELDTIAKQSSSFTIELENWANADQMVLLGSTLPGCVPPESVVLSAGKSKGPGAPPKPYKQNVAVVVECAQSGTYAGAVVAYYVNSGAWRWWPIHLRVARAASAGELSASCAARASTTFTVPLPNSTDMPQRYSVHMAADALSGQPEVIVPAGATVDYELHFQPWSVGRTQGAVSFVSDDLGEAWYTVQLEGTDPDPQDLGDHSVPIGLTQPLDAELQNPLGVPVVYSCRVDNPEAWKLAQDAVEVPPRSTALVQLTYSPTSVGRAEPVTLTCTSPRLAPYVFTARGSGIAPGVHPTPLYMECVAGSSATAAAHFRNPFAHDLEVQLTVEYSGPAATSPFTLLKRDHVSVHGKAAAQIPLVFTPPSVAKFNAQLVVAAPRQGLVWRFPVQGVAQRFVPDCPITLRNRAREPATENVTLPLPALPREIPTRITLAVRGHSEADQEWFDQFVDAAVLSIEEKTVHVELEACATKPGTGRGVLVATVEDCGGEWLYELVHNAAAPEPDDTLVLRAAIGRTATLQLALNNQLHVYTPFRAWLTVDSAPEFNVTPMSGMLAPVTEEGSVFTVSYRPKEYGRPAKGVLVVETADMQWSYALVGKPPRWDPPRAMGSRLDNRLPTDVQAARVAAARGRQGADFVRGNMDTSGGTRLK